MKNGRISWYTMTYVDFHRGRVLSIHAHDNYELIFFLSVVVSYDVSAHR